MTHTRKHLLLISYEYPYGLGETFLESEVPILAREFSTVTILPSRACYSPAWFSEVMQQHRQLPANCYLLLPGKGKKRAFSYSDFKHFISCANYRSISLKGVIYCIRELFREALKATSLMPLLRTFLGRVKPSEVIAYSYWKGAATAALCLAKTQGHLSACATRCHGGDIYYNILPFPYRSFDNYIATHCTLILPVSLNGVTYLTTKGFTQKQLKVSRLGIAKQKRQSPASNDGIFRIVTCANLIPVKRITLLCRALSTLKLPFKWVHFGDGIERPLVEKYIEEFSENNSTAILYGRVPNHEVLEYYQNTPVDIFVNISSSEGVPVSIMEALMAGIPCVATDVGGTRELVNDNCGLLLPSDITASALSQTFISIYEDLSGWQEKRNKAYRQACLLCDGGKNYEDFSQLLKETL